MNYIEAKNVLIEKMHVLGGEEVYIENAFGRLLAKDLISDKDVPSFNRSPLDGYCFNYEDTLGASIDNPKEFTVIDEVPCGKVSSKSIGKMQTIKVLTGAKIPGGANCVIKYEDVKIKNKTVELFNELKYNQNIILIGEDVKKDTILAKSGSQVDMGIVGIASSLGIKELLVHKSIKIGFISTGSELLEIDDEYVDGKIYNSNRYIFDAIFKKNNIEYNYYGIVYDDIENLERIFDKATNECDIVISTGGVSVGDYDLVDKALLNLGFDVFIKGIEMKPGMACCFAEKKNKFVFGLSGNPMSSVTTFYAVCLPTIKRMMGYSDYENKYFKVTLKNSFNKKINKTRFLRAKVEIENGIATAYLNLSQGNIIVKSLIDCNAMVIIENVAEAKEGMIFDCMYL